MYAFSPFFLIHNFAAKNAYLPHFQRFNMNQITIVKNVTDNKTCVRYTLKSFIHLTPARILRRLLLLPHLRHFIAHYLMGAEEITQL